MRRYLLIPYFSALLMLAVLPFAKVSAQPAQQQAITTPSQLIDAVNSLRLSHGLSALSVHSVLMQTAQSQADYMASTGQITHTRPGSSFTQQLLALGFPLAGDLSLGGFRAENILNNYDPLVWDGVPPAWQDADHMNTMLSPNFTHIGAGVSQGSNGYYYAVDCAAATGSGQMQGNASAILTSAPAGVNSGVNEFIIPVTINTARPDGTVIHKVENGQSLWSIAIAYGTTINNIKALNNLGADGVVYQGQELLVLRGATQPASPTATNTVAPTVTSTIEPAAVVPVSATLAVSSSTPTLDVQQFDTNQTTPSSSSFLVVILIIAALVGGGVAVWLIRDPN